MSEKIYACLLFLFPAAFRRLYGEELLRLFRDRLRDERGIRRRLRLLWDLLTDILTALPQVYGHSYAETAPAASLAPDGKGIPSFHLLRREPIRRGTILFAGVVTLTAQAVCMYVIQLPAPYHPIERNRSISPIEAVMERVRVDMANGEDMSTSASTLADAGVSATGTDSQITHPRESIEEVRHFDHRAAPTVAEPSASVPVAEQTGRGKPEAILVPSRQASPLNVWRYATGTAALPSPSWVRRPVAQSRPVGNGAAARGGNTFRAQTPAAQAADLSGEWALKSSPAGSGVPHWFVFRQYGAELRGTGGPASAEQYPILNGAVAGDSVKFELKSRGNRFLCELRFQNKALQGTLSKRNKNGTQVNTVRLERVEVTKK